MSTLAYNPSIPAGSNNPSQDYKLIQINFASIQTLVDVDHVDFGNLKYGQHKQITVSSNNVSPSLNSGVSVIYANVGIANPSVSQTFAYNGTLSFPLTAVRAYCTFTPGGGSTCMASNYFNVNETIALTNGAAGQFATITFTTGAVTGTNFGVLYSGTLSGALGFPNSATVASNQCTVGQFRVGSPATVIIIQI